MAKSRKSRKVGAPDKSRVATATAPFETDAHLAELNRRDLLLQAVSSGIAELLTADSIKEALPRVLEQVAKVVNIDRMRVVEVQHAASEQPVHLLYYVWSAPGAPVHVAPAEVAEKSPDRVELFNWVREIYRGRPLVGSRYGGDPVLRRFLTQLNVVSLLLVPIMLRGSYWGHIGIDDCHSEHDWTADEISTLKMFADLIGVAITRERYVEQLGNANTIVQNSPTILYRLRGEPSFPMEYVSQNIAQLGYDAAELLKSPTLYHSYVHPEDRARVHASMAELLHRDAPSITIQYRMFMGGGATRWVENRYTPVRDTSGRLIEVEGILIDVTERKAAEDKIVQLARTDALTGLANRATFIDRLRQAFVAAKRGARPFGVLYLDLDRFKEINDTLGHPIGDRMLQEVAERLRKLTRETDLVARLGGDEFAVLQDEVTDTAAAGVLAAKIIAALSMPHFIDGNELRVGVSVGISVMPAAGVVANPDELLVQADQALYRSKEAGRGQYHFHTAELDSETHERVLLAEELRGVLERNELELYYQPQVELASGQITGVEALIRWHHPRRGLLLPQMFLTIAEKAGVMQTLGRWVLDGACRQLRAWRDADISVLLVAVNLSLSQLRAGRELIDDIKDSLARWNLRPEDLEVGVTELILARMTLAQNDVLEELHGLGVRIAIDDFGTEYSSMDYLRTYHVSRLKVSRSMVSAAATGRAGSAMVRAIAGMAAELGVDVVAAGVETEGQRKHLMNLGAKIKGQGHLFSAAVPADQALEVLRQGKFAVE